MYCTHCGKYNRDDAKACKRCHAPLGQDVALKELPPLTEKDAKAYQDECLALAKSTHEERVEKIKDLYLPKLKAEGITASTEETIKEDYNGALADETLRYASTTKALSGFKASYQALATIRKYSQDGRIAIPDPNDSESSHVFVQYLHKVDDGLKDEFDKDMCFEILGIILLIIGVVFFVLSYKISPDPAITEKTLRFTSFEFMVSMVGFIVGGASLIFGSVQLILSVINQKRLENAILHFRIKHKLFQ